MDNILEGDYVLIHGETQGKIEEIAMHDGYVSKYKVRVLAGQEKAGTLQWVIPEEVQPYTLNTENMHHEYDDYHTEETHSETNLIKKHWKNIGIFIVVFVIAVFILKNTSNPANSELVKQTKELNEINLLDVKDLETKRNAQASIDSRKERKKELLKSISFE